MKRPYSLFVILGGLLLSAFLILSVSLLCFDYSNAKQTIEREIDRTFAHKQALLQATFDMRLNGLSLQLAQLVRQHNQDSSVHLLDYLNTFNHDAYQGYSNTFELMLLVSGDGKQCFDISTVQLPPGRACQGVAQQFDDALYDWHLFEFEGDAGTAVVGLITREPLVDPVSGYIHGYLYGGMLLSDNLSLVNRFRAADRVGSLALGIALDDRLLVANVRQDTEEYAALTRILEQGSGDYASEHYFGRGSYIPLEHEGSGRLQLVTVTGNEALLQLEQNMIVNSLIALGVSLLLAAVLALIALRITLSPLRLRGFI